MRIKEIRCYMLRAPLQKRFGYSQRWFEARSTVLVKIVTDSGHQGWGEVFCHDAQESVAALIEHTYARRLTGRDPLRIGVIWDDLYNWTKDYGQKGVTIAALSGVDIALWDILGQVTGQPVHLLLGGAFREQVQGYATGLYMREGDDPARMLAEEARTYVGRGFRAIKMKIGYGPGRDLFLVEAVRRAIGDDVALMVDANHAYDAATAIRLGRRLEPLNVAWFEEPVSPEDVDGYCEVRAALHIPIAGGEAEFTRYGFRELITRRAVDILQPDICLTGGLSEARVIAAMARAFHLRCLPHAWGTQVGLAASLHFLASLPDTPPSLHPLPALLELDQTEHPLRDAVVRRGLCIEGDCVRVPQEPGLGIVVDEEAVERLSLRPS